jgi:hypothetical protein
LTSRSLRLTATLIVGALTILYSACKTTTTPPLAATCGNGVLDRGERCDPGDPDHPCPGSDCSACATGLLSCDGGCVDPLTDRAFCGASGACSVATAGQACTSGELCAAGHCATSCPPGQVACGGLCVDPLTDRAHCGATADCSGANAGVGCDAGYICNGSGQCALSCQPGLVACGGRCVDPSADRTFCGASGDCLGGNAGVSCDAGSFCNGAGACTLSCQPGLVDCGGTCVDPRSDRAHCGASGDCAGPNAGAVCDAGFICNGSGQCELSCQPGLVACGGHCVDPSTDRAFCGASGDCAGGNAGTSCDAGSVCNGAGVCTLSCQPGLIDCSGTCVDPQSDRAHCGASGSCAGPTAGAVCDAGFVCSGGACAPSCGFGTVDCNGACIDPQTSLTYCGASGDCQGPNAGVVCDAGSPCASGVCTVAPTCTSTEQLCGASCVDVKNDPGNCGSCGNSCPDVPGATGVCSDGGCLSCPSGYRDCNDDLTLDGCETPVRYNRFACGACGNVCTDGVCDAGTCVPAKFVFVSSEFFTGSQIGGLTNGDAICQSLATDAGLPGTYRIWLSSSAGSPSSRFTHSTSPYALVDGTVIANGWSDLTDSSLLAPINKTEHNQPPPLAVGAGGGCGNVYTGTWPDGTRVGAPWECSQWTDAGSSVWGRTDLSNFGWSQWCSGGTCAVPGSVFCFEQ